MGHQLSMLDRFGTNPTQLVGVVSFAAATIACFFAAHRSALRDAPTWRTLAIVNCLFLIEIFSGFQFRIHALVDPVVGYAQRSSLQERFDISIVIIALIILALFLVRRNRTGVDARIAASITIVLLALFAIETVSLHAIDAIFYQQIGSVLLIGWLWAIAAAGISLAASRASGRPE